VRTETAPALVWTVDRELRASAGPPGTGLDDSWISLFDHYATRDPDHPAIRAHRLALTGESVSYEMEWEDRLWEVRIEPLRDAAAAVLGRELTLPELGQTVILTRAEGRTPMPPGERLEDLARHQATLALFLSITLIADVARALIPAYGADCPAIVVHKATWPDQQIVHGTLGDITEKVRAARIHSQSIILVGRVLTATGFAESRLYAAEFTHRFRRGSRRAGAPAGAEPAAGNDDTAAPGGPGGSDA